MRKTAYIIGILVLFLAVTAAAQMSDKAELQDIKSNFGGLNPVSKPFSLIDLSRLKWSHSYSISFYSGGYGSGSSAMYHGSIYYDLSSSLSLDIGIGIAHNPGALFDNSLSTDARFYPSVNLDYHPSDNFQLSIGFARYPGYYLKPYYYYYPDYYWRY
jgi:hypothetical protein